MYEFDVVAVGNSLLDIFLGIQENNAFTKLNRSDHTLSFVYEEKIHVESCEFLPGGNACNVAVGIVRLGFETALCAEIGDDEFSQKIIHILKQEPIDLSFLKQTQNAKASFSVGINYGGERTLFVEHIYRKHDFSFSGLITKWIYLTSLGEEWKASYAQIMDYVKNHDYANLAFSPGTHQFEEPNLKTIHEVLNHTYALFVNKEEAARIVKSRINVSQVEEAEIDIKTMLWTLQKFGPRIVSITDGDAGSYAINEKKEMFSLAAFPATVVEKTGAGDAYASGFLSAIINGLDVKEAMRYGAANAASVIEKVGAQTGLLTKEEIEKALGENSVYPKAI